MTYDSSFAALADPTRRYLFEALSKRPQAVGALAETVPVSRPAVSQHLKVLTDAGLVTMRKQGRSNIYAVRREGLAELRAYLDQLWGDVLTDFANEIENPKGDIP
ncbi:ArsR/SmtB family transcription factor [Shimia sp.]|uniref:ArsR/SmtB family transcription factor n=1 Tax=Shimia sp. TaxID=1954381 RepID=UPI003BACC1E3